MSRPPKFDLKRDSPRALREQWLEPGESLIDYAPVWKLPALDGIPKPPLPREQVWRRVAKVMWLLLMWIVFSVVLLVVLALVGDGLSGAGPNAPDGKKGPLVVLRGQGRNSAMGRLVMPTLRAPGLWLFTDRRIAFAVPEGAVVSKLWSGGQLDDSAALAPLRTIIEVRHGGYVYEGEVDRLRRTRFLRQFKPAGVYRRVNFPDGSGIDLRKRS